MPQLPRSQPEDDVRTRTQRTAFTLIGIALALSLFWGMHFQRKYGPGSTPPSARLPETELVDAPGGRVEIRRSYSPEGALLREEAFRDGKPVPMPAKAGN